MDEETFTCEVCGGTYPISERCSDGLCMNCTSSFLQKGDGIDLFGDGF